MPPALPCFTSILSRPSADPSSPKPEISPPNESPSTAALHWSTRVSSLFLFGDGILLFLFHSSYSSGLTRGSGEVVPWLPKETVRRNTCRPSHPAWIDQTSSEALSVGFLRKESFMLGRRTIYLAMSPQVRFGPGCGTPGWKPTVRRKRRPLPSKPRGGSGPARKCPAREGGRKRLASRRRRRAHAPSRAGLGLESQLGSRSPAGPGRGGRVARGRERRRRPPLAAGLFIPRKKFRSGR